MTGAVNVREGQHKVAEAKFKYNQFLRSRPRYIRKGECNHCGWCCLKFDPPCPYLVMDEGESHCNVHGTKSQPDGCKRFPELPPIKNPKCGYYFIDTWDNNRRLGVHEV